MIKSLDRKLAAIHANPNCGEFILADAKDADMATGLGAPGQSPELHAGEVRFKTLEQYREQMRLITRQGLVDIMLMSASSNYALTFGERLFDGTAVTPAIRANDTTDIHLARGSSYAAEASRPFRTASIDHAQCGHLDCSPEERTRGANLGLYSVTFNNDLRRDVETLERFHAFREEAERKGFRYFLEVFDPNVATGLDPAIVPHYLNDMITRMLAGVAPAGRPDFLKIVYHGPKAMEELVRFDRNLIVGILGGSSGTTRDAFQLLADAQKYGAKVALFGRKINNAENQLAFVQFLRLIVDGQIGPVDAVKAYHAVLARLGVAPQRRLEDDLKVTTQSMSYAGGGLVTVPAQPAAVGPTTAPLPSPSSNGAHACSCHDHGKPAATHANGNSFAAVFEQPKPLVTESKLTSASETPSFQVNGRPDFARMTPTDRLAYHRQRLGLGR
ncbi:hypothetical protein [Paludisphaera borealis]|uniref:Fructose-bisphosphate aldolase n=1 Tax=Paludisphaera borealis TaxID=1387353 RepID=A0A1U7CVP9_9BACT|nr:hypothetical protein [Paludisphaera borealis]APW62976.1 hypothetical protein BSF38_04534 [Paludisphaera borealis]